MFSKRRYNRKKGTKRLFRRRISKIARILRPVHANIEHAAPVIQKPSFDASGTSVYLWQYLLPKIASGEVSKGKNVASLRQLCAYQVASNAEALSLEYLSEAPWTCWEHVWKNILAMEKDSPDLFRMFALEFGSKPSFCCHESSFGAQRSAGLNIRSLALELALIPVHRKHRVENVFSNISVADFVSFVAKLPCSVVAECSNMNSFSSTQLISLSSLPNLVALDLSGNALVDDQFLYTLRLCIVSKQLNLKILRISGCPNVTQRGIASLFDKDQDVPLCYIETDVYMLSKSSFAQRFVDVPLVARHSPVPNTKWKLLDENDASTLEVAYYSLAYKLHYLSRNTELIGVPNMVWDFKFFSETIDLMDLHHASNMLQETWAKRLRSTRMKSAYAPYCYLKDLKQDIIPEVSSKCPVETSQVFTRQGTVEVKKSTARKPKLISTDVNKFFGI